MFRPMFHTFALIFALATPAVAQDAAMTPERLTDIILAIDPDAAINASGIELTIEGIQVLVVMAPGADRMRAMVPIASVEDVTPEEMNRMM
jgi:hypothetical protein